LSNNNNIYNTTEESERGIYAHTLILISFLQPPARY